MFPLRDHNISHKFPVITVLLILANIYGFWLELSAPRAESFILEHALLPAAVNFGNFATLVPFFTSMFLHGGWFHLLSNMWFLWIFGDNVEDRFGKIKYFFFYIAAGLVAGLSQYAINPQSTIPMLGASGAVAGVLGGYLIFFPRHRIDMLVPIFFIEIIPLPSSVVIGYWFLTQLFAGVGALTVQTAASGGIAFFAHIGGFLTGLILAAPFRRKHPTLHGIDY